MSKTCRTMDYRRPLLNDVKLDGDFIGCFTKVCSTEDDDAITVATYPTLSTLTVTGGRHGRWMVDGWSMDGRWMVDARCDADAMMVHAAWNSNVYLSVDGGDPME